MRVLNIPVSAELRALWRGWLAPARQPFFLTGEEAAAFDLQSFPRAELTLTPDGWQGLGPRRQRNLLRIQEHHRRGNLPRRRDYVDLLTDAVLERIVSDDDPPCQKSGVPESVWEAASAHLPRVRELAGTFAPHSGANCFGAVMGAAGVNGAENEWMQREPFEAFLRDRTQPGGDDAQPGTVLLWRSADGLAQHAAVTLGGGWAFHKASQVWTSPRLVLSVSDLKRAARQRGQRLSRRSLR